MGGNKKSKNNNTEEKKKSTDSVEPQKEDAKEGNSMSQNTQNTDKIKQHVTEKPVTKEPVTEAVAETPVEKEEKQDTEVKENKDDGQADEEDPGVSYKPVVQLTEEVNVKTNEENEDVMFKIRAKLFRFDSVGREWKERGTGDVRFLKDRDSGKTRIVMRRDRTLKVCANHYVFPWMRLTQNIGCERSWVWGTEDDVSDGKSEKLTLAIRFANSDHANKFKDAFNRAKEENEKLYNKDELSAAQKKGKEEESEY